MTQLQSVIRRLADHATALEALAKELATVQATVPEPQKGRGFRIGAKVGYKPRGYICWTGVVIPRPYDADPLSPVTRIPLVFVIREDGTVWECFAHSLTACL